MKQYKEVSKLIKTYISAAYGDKAIIASSEDEVREFLTDFMSVLQKYNIILKFEMEFKERYEGIDAIPVTLQYSFDEKDEKTYRMELLF